MRTSKIKAGDGMALMRIDKIVASSGKASRREVKALLKTGRITVDGKKVSSADFKADPDLSEVCFDGERIIFEEHHYFMMNKPAGYISSTDDPRDKTVLELVPEEYAHLDLFPAGRLDKDAEGLLILTDDGDYCHNVISPKKHVFKKYYVETSEDISPAACSKFEEGIVLSDGTQLLPGRLEITGKRTAHVYIREGKFHQVKKMMAFVGSPVVYLKRLKIGNLVINEGLKPGKMIKMTKDEAFSVFGDIV